MTATFALMLCFVWAGPVHAICACCASMTNPAEIADESSDAAVPSCHAPKPAPETQDPALPNIKAFVANCMGCPAEEVTEQAVEEIVGDENPMGGRCVRVVGRTIKTRRDTDFTTVNWKHEVPPEELLTILSDEVKKVYFNDGADLTDPQQVGLAVGYKGEHWINRADALADPLAREDFMAEGMRQLTKQTDNQAIARLEAINSQRAVAGLSEARMPDRLQQAVDIMRQVNPKPGSGVAAISPAEAEHLLATVLDTDVRTVATELGGFVEAWREYLDWNRG